MLDAAIRLLSGRPDAGMAAIAAAAGVTRQTVYAHFGTRDALLEAVAARLTQEAMAAMDAAEVEEGPALGALLRLQDIGWRLFTQNPVLNQIDTTDTQADWARHEPVVARLTRLIEKGQAAGEFDPDPPAVWLVAAVMALGHSAGDGVAAGHMTVTEARACLRTATLGVLKAQPVRPPTAQGSREATPRREGALPPSGCARTRGGAL